MNLSVPGRSSAKPREIGLTAIIDNGLPVNYLTDIIESNALYVDIVKLGWGTSLVTPYLEKKLELLERHQIPTYFGGTLFEIAYMKNRIEDYLCWLNDCGITIIEISVGSVDMPEKEKLDFIRSLSGKFKVLSEYGSKDDKVVFAPSHWVRNLKLELEAGADMVICEGRESGTIGLYRKNEEVRTGLVQEIAESGIPLEKIIFEAPIRHQQAWFINNIGVNVNLGNVAPADIIGLETLRCGLRVDTISLQQ